MATRFVFKRVVQFAETDAAGFLHFSNYFRLIEEAEHAFWRSVGLSVITSKTGNEYSWPRVAASCEYFAPARFEEELVLTLEVSRIGKKSISYTVEITCGRRRVAAGKATIACCQIIDRQFKAVPIPEFIRSRLTRPRRR